MSVSDSQIVAAAFFVGVFFGMTFAMLADAIAELLFRWTQRRISKAEQENDE